MNRNADKNHDPVGYRGNCCYDIGWNSCFILLKCSPLRLPESCRKKPILLFTGGTAFINGTSPHKRRQVRLGLHLSSFVGDYPLVGRVIASSTLIQRSITTSIPCFLQCWAASSLMMPCCSQNTFALILAASSAIGRT